MDAIRRLPFVIDQTGASRSTIYIWITAGLWPRPVSLGTRMVGWPSSEINSLIRARIRGASDDEIRQLVTELQDARKAVA